MNCTIRASGPNTTSVNVPLTWLVDAATNCVNCFLKCSQAHVAISITEWCPFLKFLRQCHLREGRSWAWVLVFSLVLYTLNCGVLRVFFEHSAILWKVLQASNPEWGYEYIFKKRILFYLSFIKCPNIFGFESVSKEFELQWPLKLEKRQHVV